MTAMTSPVGRRSATLVVALAMAARGVGSPTPTMQTPPPTWAGWARCEVQVQGTGYSEQQTHTWTMTGAAPAIEGAFRVYPATWNVVGKGSLQRSQGSQSLVAEWAINATMPAPLAVFVRASDGRMFIQARHAQLRQPGGVAGYQQQTIDGKPQPPGQIGSEAFEWAFPTIDAAATNTTVIGSSTPAVNGSVGYMQQAGARGTASCTWQFGQGAAAPAPPPTLAAVNIPVPSGNAGGTPPANGVPGAPDQPAFSVPTATGPVLIQPPATLAGVPPTATAGPAPPGALGVPTLNGPVAPPTATLAPIQPARLLHTQGFSSTGQFTVPDGVTEITVELWGAGAGGHRGEQVRYSPPTTPGKGGGGGGGGAYAAWTISRINPGTRYTIIVGVGGKAESAYAAPTHVPAGDGTDTQIRYGQMVLLSAPGGKAAGAGGQTESIDGLSSVTLQNGNPGAPGGAAERLPGRLYQPGGAGGQGGAGIVGSFTKRVAGAGGSGGWGQSVATCKGYDAQGYAINCSYGSWPSGGRGVDGRPGFAMISW